MSLVTSIWTWVLIVVFGGAPMMDSSNTPPPPGQSASADDSETPHPHPLPILSGEDDRIYVGF
jgi:hypothetical protein